MLEKFNRITESFFLTALGCYLAYAAISATTFQLPLPAKTLYVLFFLLGIGAFGRFLVNTADLVREKNRERMFCYFLAVFFAIVCVLCYHSMHSGYLLLLGAAAVGSVGISYQKLLKTYLLSAGVVLAVTVLAALGGFITNYVQLKEGHLRSSWGTGYPTDFASWVLYTMMFLWLSLRRCPRILQPVFACVSFLIACFIAYAVNSVVCSALFFTAILVIIGKDRIALPGVMKRMSRGLLIGAFPIMGAVMFTLMGLYFHKNTLAYTFDSFLHSRVSLAAAAFQEYGITAFGKAFEMYGFGFSQYAPSSYNFVDSSYPLILLRYGAVFLAVAAVLWMSSTARALRKKNWKLALVLALIAVHGFMEHHFTELNFNILLLAAFSDVSWTPEKECTLAEEKEQLLNILVRHLPSLCVLALTCLLAPSILAVARTLAQADHWNAGGMEGYTVIAGILCLLIAFCFLLGSLDAIWNLQRHKDRANIAAWRKTYRRPVLGLCIGLSVLAIYGGWGFSAIRYLEKQLTVATSDEDRVLSMILNHAEGKVYSNELPALFTASYPKIRSSIFSGDELARYASATVITDHDDDSNCLVRKGFLFGEISDRYAFYTNDDAVIEAFRKSGRMLKGYYSAERKVDLNSLAEGNGLPCDTEGVLLQAGDSMDHGNAIGLYSGSYTARYELRLAENKGIPSGVAEQVLRLAVKDDDRTLAEKVVTAADFDQKGECSVELTYTTAETSQAAFLADCTGQDPVVLRAITYQKTPDYDVHYQYDGKGRVARASWYTLEGDSYIFPQGYHSVEYRYDSQDNQTMLRYLDADGQPMITTDGWAEIQRKYNARRQVVRETFYDTKEQILTFSKGHSCITYQYDQNGNRTDVLYCDAEGNPVDITDGFAEIQYAFNDNGKIIQESYYDSKGRKRTLLAGYQSIQYQYDEEGNQTDVQYCDENGNPAMTSSGFAEIRREYDSHKVMQEAFFDDQGAPVTFSKNYSLVQYQYDEAGNQSLVRYCDFSGNLVDISDGYAELRRTFDGQNRVSTEEYFTSSGIAFTRSEGSVMTKYAYDELGRQILVQYCDEDGNPVNTSNGYSAIKKAYDAQNWQTSEEYLDADGKAVLLPAGYSSREFAYDIHGNQTAISCYDPSHNLVNCQDGYARLSREFDSYRRVMRETYWDAAQQPVSLPRGYAAVTYEYDARGNCLQIKYLDTTNQPVVILDGFARIQRSYNDRNQVVKEEYYLSDGSRAVLSPGQSGYQAYYDWNGNQTSVRYLGSTGDFSDVAEGYCEVKKDYDRYGRQIREAYYSTKGEPVQLTAGYASWQREYAPDGSVLSTVYYDKNGEPVTPQY